MTKMVSLPGWGVAGDLNWFATGGLFDDVARFILERVRNAGASDETTGAIASGYLFVGDLPEPALTGILLALRDEFPQYVDVDVYPPAVASKMDHAEIFIARAKSLADMARRSIALRESGAEAAVGAGPTVLSAQAVPGVPLKGRVRWAETGSIDFLPDERSDPLARAGAIGSTSINLGPLQIEVGITTHQLLYVRGHSPRLTWRRKELSAPDAKPGAVFMTPDEPFLPGVPFAMGRSEDWEVERDDRSGWLRVADSGGSRHGAENGAEVVTLIADHTGVGVSDGRISSVWLRFGS